MRIADAAMGIAVASMGRFMALTQSATGLVDTGCGGSV